MSHGLLAGGWVGAIIMPLPDVLEGIPDACIPCPDADERKDALLGNPELGVHLLATDGQLRKEQSRIGAQITAGPQGLENSAPEGSKGGVRVGRDLSSIHAHGEHLAPNQVEAHLLSGGKGPNAWCQRGRSPHPPGEGLTPLQTRDVGMGSKVTPMDQDLPARGQQSLSEGPPARLRGGEGVEIRDPMAWR